MLLAEQIKSESGLFIFKKSFYLDDKEVYRTLNLKNTELMPYVSWEIRLAIMRILNEKLEGVEN